MIAEPGNRPGAYRRSINIEMPVASAPAASSRSHAAITTRMSLERRTFGCRLSGRLARG